MQLEKQLYYSQDGITVERSTRQDAEFIAFNMRKQDRDEIWASHNFTPQQAVKYSIEKTIFCLTVKIENRPVCLFGVNGVTILGNSGVVWLLSTDEIEKIGFRFARHSRHFVNIMLEYYPVLFNHVSVENTVSINWLKMLGAKFDTAKPFGIEQRLFRYFSFHKEK